MAKRQKVRRSCCNSRGAENVQVDVSSNLTTMQIAFIAAALNAVAFGLPALMSMAHIAGWF